MSLLFYTLPSHTITSQYIFSKKPMYLQMHSSKSRHFDQTLQKITIHLTSIFLAINPTKTLDFFLSTFLPPCVLFLFGRLFFVGMTRRVHGRRRLNEQSVSCCGLFGGRENAAALAVACFPLFCLSTARKCALMERNRWMNFLALSGRMKPWLRSELGSLNFWSFCRIFRV